MRHAQPAVEHGRVDAAEVDGVARIAVVEVGQVGVGAVQAGLDRTAQQEDRGRGAVVGAAAAVLAQAAAELGEDQDQHPVGFARFLQVVEERRERRPELAQQSSACCWSWPLWVSKPSRWV